MSVWLLVDGTELIIYYIISPRIWGSVKMTYIMQQDMPTHPFIILLWCPICNFHLLLYFISHKHNDIHNAIIYIMTDYINIWVKSILRIIMVVLVIKLHLYHISQWEDIVINVSKDGDSKLISYHIIYSGESLSVHIAILFKSMLRHVLTPDDMLTDRVIHIPKGRW